MTRRRIFFSLCAAVVIATLVLAREVLLPFVLALVIAYVLLPLVLRVQRPRLHRAGAILIVYVAVLGSLGAFLDLSAPRLVSEMSALRVELPVLAEHLRDDWVPNLQNRLRRLGILPPPEPPAKEVEAVTPAIVVKPQADGSIGIDIGSGLEVEPRHHGGYRVVPTHEEAPEGLDPQRIISDAVGQSVEYAQSNALELARMAQGVIFGISRAIFVFGITLMLAAYLMITKEPILGFLRSLVRPEDRLSWDALLERIDRGLSGVVRGQLIICLINGTLSAIGFALFGLKFWPILAVVSTIFSLVPIFGSIASSVPAVLLALTQSVSTAVLVLVWILGIHQLEANFLNPKIMGDQARIHPVLVIFSLLVGEHWFHAVGALLAVPVMSIVQSLFLHFRERIDGPEDAAEAVAAPAVVAVVVEGAPSRTD